MRNVIFRLADGVPEYGQWNPEDLAEFWAGESCCNDGEWSLWDHRKDYYMKQLNKLQRGVVSVISVTYDERVVYVQMPDKE